VPGDRRAAQLHQCPTAARLGDDLGRCIGWRLWIEVIDGQERPVAGSPRHLTLYACGRHGGGEGIAWRCEVT
jgi:hypothetical protein